MKITLTDAEKTVLANYLAEKSIAHAKELYDNYGMNFTKEHQRSLFELNFEYYKKILTETEDY